jgi:hypothetical protein
MDPAAESALAAPALPVFARIWRGYANQALGVLSDYLLAQLSDAFDTYIRRAHCRLL